MLHMRFFKLLYLISFFLIFNCSSKKKENVNVYEEIPSQYITVLGIAQDAGFPQINCEKECCKSFYIGEESKKMVSCLGLVDLENEKKWVFDATPDIAEQLQILKDKHLDNGHVIDGVFLTHAHIGHYTGLMQFGRESMGANKVPVFLMPEMHEFITKNQPWKQLVDLNNVEIKKLQRDSTIILNSKLEVTPIIVPHRDELSETVGYSITGENKSALFIPDINKWEIWERSIIEEVKKVDYAFIDATFFKNGEINRPMNEVPHPFIEETVNLFKEESNETKAKVYFIHLNHTNPALKNKHPLKDSIQSLGFKFAKEGTIFRL